MKILLIRPPGDCFEPLGLMYLASYIRRFSNCEVKILDMSLRIKAEIENEKGLLKDVRYTDETLDSDINNFNPDLVGISSMYTIHAKGTHDIARAIKRIKKGTPVIVGGAHASAIPEIMLEDNNIDAVVVGEGEQPLLEIVKRFNDDTSMLGINGAVTRKDTNKSGNPQLFIEDLDAIPLPARDLVDMKSYMWDRYNYRHSMSPPRAAIISSRGCPYNCIYCATHSVWKHTYRMRSPKKVVDEIDYLITTYGIREIMFWDDNLTLDKNRMIGICNEIIKRKIKIKWCTPNGVAISTLDRELIAKMRESGCYKLTFGIDTGSDKTQEFIRKQYIDLGKAKEITRYCNRVGIWTHSTFIIGFPYETKKDILQTLSYALDCDADMVTFFIATPYPGTEMYELYKKEGFLSKELEKYPEHISIAYMHKPLHKTKYFTQKQLHECLALFKKRLYIRRALQFLNPLRMIQKIMKKDEFKYFVRQLLRYSKILFRHLAA